MNKKILASVALALVIILVGTVSAFVVSTNFSKTATIERVEGIKITSSGFPETIELGKLYTVTTYTENVLDQTLTGLTTTITITPTSEVYIPWASLTVTYADTWDGGWSGTLPFVQSGYGLICTIPDWDAPAEYYNTATMTLIFDAQYQVPEEEITLTIVVDAPFK